MQTIFLFAKIFTMKTILVDAYNTLFTEHGIDTGMLNILETFQEPKIVLTNANDEQMVTFGIDQSPYPVFTLKHQPNKPEGGYYEKMLEAHALEADECIYFEHNKNAVEMAQKLGIISYHFDHTERDLSSLKEFIKKNL